MASCSIYLILKTSGILSLSCRSSLTNQHCISSQVALLLTLNRGRSGMRLCRLWVDLYISSSSCCQRSICLDIEGFCQDCWIARLLYPPCPVLGLGGRERKIFRVVMFHARMKVQKIMQHPTCINMYMECLHEHVSSDALCLPSSLKDLNPRCYRKRIIVPWSVSYHAWTSTTNMSHVGQLDFFVSFKRFFLFPHINFIQLGF